MSGRTVPILHAAVLAASLCAATGCGSDADRPSSPAPTPGVATPQRDAPTVTTRAARGAAPSANPAGWPRTLKVGLVDPEDGAGALARRAPFGMRWHYLAGGASTPNSWDAWRTGDGSFATAYLRDSASIDTLSLLSYYVLQETPPVSALAEESEKVLRGLADAQVMRAVVADLRVALTRMGEAGGAPNVLQVEPDLWGYVQQERGGATTRAAIAGTDPLAAGLPGTLRGFATLVERIRDEVAPKVLLAYPVSIWGTDKDIVGSDPSREQVTSMAASTVRFWRSLGRPFDTMTFEFANRDAGYQVQVDGVRPADAWWSRDNEARHLQYVKTVLGATKRTGILWQVPPGNTARKVMDDTPGRYRDDKVQRLLGRKGRPLLRAYRDAGVVAVLFGSAFPKDTCACVRRDGLAGPGEDDGGYLSQQVRRYVQGGELPLRRIPRRAG